MTQDTRIALFLMGELVAALRANHSDDLEDLLLEWQSIHLHCIFVLLDPLRCLIKIFAGDIGGANKLYPLIKGLIPGQFDCCVWPAFAQHHPFFVNGCRDIDAVTVCPLPAVDKRRIDVAIYRQVCLFPYPAIEVSHSVFRDD